MTQLKIDSVVVAVPSLSKSSIRLLVDDREVNVRAPVEVAPGAVVQLRVYAFDEDGLVIRRVDHALEFIVNGSQQVESGEGTKRVVANYVAAKSAYCAEIVLPQETGEYRLQLDRVFGFGLRNGNFTATSSLASPILLIMAAEPISRTQRALTIGVAVVLVLGLGGLLVYARKQRENLKELLFSMMSNEGMQGLQIANDVIDFASDAFLYSTVVRNFAHLHTLFMGFTICFALACLVSSVGLFLKLRALLAQLRTRNRAFTLRQNSAAGAGAIGRKMFLANRLAENGKDRMLTYAAVITCAFEGKL
jgi:hypothetical protein